MALKQIITGDGSWTFYSEQYRQTYHSMSGAVEESFGKYVNPTSIKSLATNKKELRILDVCFGLGYNALAAWHTIQQVNPALKLTLVTLEKDVRLLKTLTKMALPSPFEEYQPIIEALVNEGCYRRNQRQIRLIVGDVLQILPRLEEKFDAVFWDPFSMKSNPELWTVEIFKTVKGLMTDQAVLATYSSSIKVRRNLANAGFKLGAGPAVGRKSASTLASIAFDLPPLPDKITAKLETMIIA